MSDEASQAAISMGEALLLRARLGGCGFRLSTLAVGRYLIGLMASTKAATCFPKHETIAEQCGCSVSTVKRALTKLKDGLVVKWRQRTISARNAPGGRHLVSNLYGLATDFRSPCRSLILSEQSRTVRKPIEKEAGRVESPAGLQPIVVTEALLRSRLVGGGRVARW